MPDFIGNLVSVITPLAVLYAIASGTVLGSTFLVWITLLRPPLTYLPPIKAVVFGVVILGSLGTVFFTGQITQSLIEGANSNEPARVFARYLLWMLFSLSVAVSHTFSVSFARRKDIA